MKQIYFSLILLLTITTTNAQGYKFGIMHNTNNNFSVIAITDFDGTNTDISDVGFALMLPTGNIDVTNLTQFNGRTWSSTEVTASQLTVLGLGDGTRDLFLLNMPPGQTILSHTNGQQIVLVSFDITNMPMTGEMSILLNSDPIAIGLGGSVDSFYNSNIDATTTQNYFSGLAVGMESFDFSTLGIEDNRLANSLEVYPNPVSETLYISSPIKLDRVELFDVLGKQVLSTTETKQLKVDYLQSGLYVLKIFGNEGNSTTKKVVIE